MAISWRALHVLKDQLTIPGLLLLLRILVCKEDPLGIQTRQTDRPLTDSRPTGARLKENGFGSVQVDPPPSRLLPLQVELPAESPAASRCCCCCCCSNQTGRTVNDQDERAFAFLLNYYLSPPQLPKDLLHKQSCRPLSCRH